jgi:hypothetical protein
LKERERRGEMMKDQITRDEKDREDGNRGMWETVGTFVYGQTEKPKDLGAIPLGTTLFTPVL